MKYFIPIIILFFTCKNASSDVKITELTINSEYTSKVIGIIDGDTYDILIDKSTFRIRVDAIDAPEKGMPYYKVSKKYLAELCFGDSVHVLIKDIDKNGRYIGRTINSKGKDISIEMIRAGLAWHYKKYNDEMALANYEDSARKYKVGLWGDPHIIAPWEVRRMH
ncbi:MAG: thermonuclease family protein [Bacteroidetes bacterium]|nr:thermonuclease family protein [Bacteroidota bacterium]